MGSGLGPSGMRKAERNRPPLRPGRLCRIRLLRQSLPLLLGPAAASAVHAARPKGFAITGAKADERQVLLSILDDQTLPTGRAGQVTGDKNYHGHDFEAALPTPGSSCSARPAKTKSKRPGSQFFRAAAADHRVGQRHVQGATPRLAPPGVLVRVLHRVLARHALANPIRLSHGAHLRGVERNFTLCRKGGRVRLQTADLLGDLAHGRVDVIWRAA